MSDEFEMETHRVIFGQYGKLTVRPDGDGLGLLEVDGGGDYGRLTIAPEGAILLAKAILSLACEMTGHATPPSVAKQEDGTQ